MSVVRLFPLPGNVARFGDSPALPGIIGQIWVLRRLVLTLSTHLVRMPCWPMFSPNRRHAPRAVFPRLNLGFRRISGKLGAVSGACEGRGRCGSVGVVSSPSAQDLAIRALVCPVKGRVAFQRSRQIWPTERQEPIDLPGQITGRIAVRSAADLNIRKP